MVGVGVLVSVGVNVDVGVWDGEGVIVGVKLGVIVDVTVADGSAVCVGDGGKNNPEDRPGNPQASRTKPVIEINVI